MMKVQDWQSSRQTKDIAGAAANTNTKALLGGLIFMSGNCTSKEY
jgi:hypothetical protein